MHLSIRGRALIFGAMVILALAACSPQAIEGSGNRISEVRQAAGASSVRLEGAGRLIILQDAEPGLTIQADDNILPHLQSQVEDGVLIIDHDRPLEHSQPPDFTVTMPSLEDVWAAGSIEVNIQGFDERSISLLLDGSANATVSDLQLDEFEVEIAGSGGVIASGRADHQQLTIGGSGTFDGTDMLCETAELRVTGSANVLFNCQESLDLTVAGDANVAYLGQPTISRQVTGELSLEPLGSR